MRIFHIQGDQFAELAALPETLPPAGYLWASTGRDELEAQLADMQTALQRWTGSQIVDLHVSDLLNRQLPSQYDYTSWYDILVFRRLVAGPGTSAGNAGTADELPLTPTDVRTALDAIDTSPVGFALFDRVLLTVHPGDCQVRDFFAQRLQSQASAPDGRGELRNELRNEVRNDVRNTARMPPTPADLMLRMVNHMVDGYLELRRLLTRNLGFLQQQLFNPGADFSSWPLLLESRNTLHLLEDTCEDQRAAITEWIDGLDELPDEPDKAARRERELLRVRSRDVLEHIERVLTHVRRLESSAENAVQMHFSAQSNRTNEIMRTLTVLTAIFMPLNLVTGFFGMNFEGLPLIHSRTGFWTIFGVMLVLGVGASVFFWRKRYLVRSKAG